MQTDTITVKEAAQRLGIGINQAYEACERGDLPSIRLGKRWLIPRFAFEAWLASCATAAQDTSADKYPKIGSENNEQGVVG